MSHSSTSLPMPLPTQPSTLAPSTQRSMAASDDCGAISGSRYATFQRNAQRLPSTSAFNVTPNGTFNANDTPIVEALNVEALNDGTLIDETFNDRALDVYTLFLFKFIKNFASQVALGGSKFAYLCGHIT